MSPSLVVLLLISICGLQLLEAQPQDMKVSCSSTVSCNGGDDIGLMTVRECCVENPNGLAYRYTNNSCNPCIVFGFFQEDFIGVEGWDHVVKVGFQKGAVVVGHNLVFHVNDTAGTARKGRKLDYSVKTGRVKVRLSDPRNIVLSFHADGTAQEGDENFTLQLISSSVLPSTDAMFFRNTLNVTIKDNDMLTITFEREVYTVVENEGSVEVCFITNTGHMDKTEVVIELIPLTKRTDHSTPGNSDINTAPQTEFFEVSDSKQKLCVTFEIFDDVTDESDEDFVVKFSNLPNEQCVLGAIPQAYITIRDNDVPEFSITPIALTVLESAGEVEICITTNSSLAREIEVTAEPGQKGRSHNPAKANIDIEMTAITLTFLPSEESKSVQTHCGIVRIIDDTIGNEDEEFSITLISASPEGSFGVNIESSVIIRDDDRIIRNDSVIGDPLYVAPIYSEDGKEYSLCYEVNGRANSTFNLVSDTCVNVNARYSAVVDPAYYYRNIITAVGVRARALSASSCHNIRVDANGCSTTVETPDGNSQPLASLNRFENDGISVRRYPSRVRISVPNCENIMLVIWMVCHNIDNQDVIEVVISRGVNLRPSSHGLLGQFWNIPVYVTRYNSTDLLVNIDYLDLDSLYVVIVHPESSPARSFLGEFYTYKWDATREPCLYVGNDQGGPISVSPDPNDSVIEGDYWDYILEGGDENLFETNYTYSQFEENRCYN